MYIYISIHPSTLAKGNHARRLGGLIVYYISYLFVSLQLAASQRIRLDSLAILDFSQTYLIIPAAGSGRRRTIHEEDLVGSL